MPSARLQLATRLAARADQWFTRARAAVLDHLPCQRGCHQCCLGPFAVTVLDVDRLQQGLRELAPDTRAKILERAHGQVEAMEVAFPRLRTTPFLDHWGEVDLDLLAGQFQTEPCPALQPDGSCGVYAWRPATCRLMGIPHEQDGLVQGACQVQTSVPILRLPDALRAEETAFAHHESGAIAALQLLTNSDGEEVLLPYGFLPDRVL